MRPLLRRVSIFFFWYALLYGSGKGEGVLPGVHKDEQARQDGQPSCETAIWRLLRGCQLLFDGLLTGRLWTGQFRRVYGIDNLGVRLSFRASVVHCHGARTVMVSTEPTTLSMVVPGPLKLKDEERSPRRTAVLILSAMFVSTWRGRSQGEKLRLPRAVGRADMQALGGKGYYGDTFGTRYCIYTIPG